MAIDAEPESLPPAGRSVIVPADPAHPRKLSEEFALILREFEVETVTLREVIGLLHGRGFVLLIMLLALPFCTPVPLPGLSTPFGLIITIIGVRLAFGAKPWLPSRLLDTRLPPNVFAKVFSFTRKVVLGFERLLRPRLLWVTASPRLTQLRAIPIGAFQQRDSRLGHPADCCRTARARRRVHFGRSCRGAFHGGVLHRDWRLRGGGRGLSVEVAEVTAAASSAARAEPGPPSARRWDLALPGCG
jgi:hypothetical protein